MSHQIPPAGLGHIAPYVLACLCILPAECAPQRRVEPRRPAHVSRRAATNGIMRVVSVHHEGLDFTFRVRATRRAASWRLSIVVDVSTRGKGYKLSDEPFYMEMAHEKLPDDAAGSTGFTCHNCHEIKPLIPGRVRTYHVFESQTTSTEDYQRDVSRGEYIWLNIGLCKIPSGLGRPVSYRQLLFVKLTVHPGGRAQLALKATTAIYSLAIGNWSCSDGATIKIGPSYMLVILEKRKPHISLTGHCRLMSKQGRLFNLVCHPAVLNQNLPALAAAIRQLPCARKMRQQGLWNKRDACLRPLLPEKPAPVTVELLLDPKSAVTTLRFPRTGRTCTTKLDH